MEKEVLSFRDKIGKIMTTLGIAFIFSAIIVLVSWPFLPLPSRLEINIPKVLMTLVFIGIVLIRLSLFTVKK